MPRGAACPHLAGAGPQEANASQGGTMYDAHFSARNPHGGWQSFDSSRGSEPAETPSEHRESFTNVLFSFEGRLRRSTYWVAGILSGIALVLLIVAAAYLGGFFLALLILPVGWWISLSLAVKRFHDRSMSGWWVLPLVTVPGLLMNLPTTSPLFWVGAAVSLVGFVILGFLPGVEGENEYGPDPKEGEY